MHRFLSPGRIVSAVGLACALASCGGGDPDASAAGAGASAAASAGRERRLSVPVGTTIPADASTKGLFGPLQPWPLIAVHGVLTSDGRVLSYGTTTAGIQTGYYNYDVWNPADNSHLQLGNTTATDIFCSSQMMLPDGGSVVISGGDVINAAGTQSTNGGNNNSNVFNVAARTLTRGGNMNRARWYSSSTMLLNGEVYIQGGSGGTDRPEIRSAAGASCISIYG